MKKNQPSLHQLRCLALQKNFATIWLTIILIFTTLFQVTASQNYWQETKLNFINKNETSEKQIVIASGEEVALNTATQQAVKTITGKVTDNSGTPLPGVSVVVKGTTTGAITDTNGNFTIATPENGTLQFSFVGMKSQEITASGKTNISIKMSDEAIGVDEVVVVGYGTQKKANLTGAVDQVGEDVFKNRPVANVSQGLVGAVPNLNIKMLDGKPTQSPSYNIRGTTSIGQGGSALILIDGVEGDPRMLNPNDIASVSVLKDAASASIYGARAAFGVVLITTKDPEKGKTSVSYSGNFSIKSPTEVPDNIVDSYPWAKGFNDSWANWNDAGTTPTAINKTMSFSPAYLAEIKRRYEDQSLPRIDVNPQTGEYMYFYSTDWYKELYKNNFLAKDHNISLSGGNDIASFYVTGRYNGHDGLFKYNSDTYSMYNFRAKGIINLTKWLSIDNNMEYSSMKYHNPLNVGEGSGIWRNIADEGHPLAPMLNPDKTISFPAAYTVGDYYYGKNGIDTKRRVLKDKIAAKATFLNKKLIVRADFTFQTTDDGQTQKRVQVPYSRYKDKVGYAGAATNDYQKRNQLYEYYATNLYAEYTKSIAEKHNFNFLLGYNYEQSIYNNLTAFRNGIIYEGVEDIGLALGQNFDIKGGYNKWRISGGFFRVNYNFAERYLLEVNGRYDGSSKFPTNQQYAFFPSISAGWRLSEEKFWHVSDKILSDVKIRASFGSLGNGNIDPYKFLETFNVSQSGRILNGVRPARTGQPGVIPEGLTWETSTTANVGLDFAMLSRRLHFSGDAYQRNTKDMFTVGPSLPAIYGTDVPKGNYADMKTVGWEISISWADRFALAGKPFNYDARFILSDYQSTITKYNNPDKLLTDHYVGKKVGEIWGYQVEGLFRTQAEIDAAPSQKNIQSTNTKKNYVGDIKFRNLDNDNIIYNGLNRVGNSGDLSIIGNSEPRFAYGLNLSSDWNGLFFSAFFQGVMKQDYFPGPESRFWGQYNRPYNAYPRWQEGNIFREELQNFDAYLPRLSGYTAQSNRELGVPSDRYLQNASYIRLRNIQIGYTFPKGLTSKIKASDLKLYLSAENIWTWSPMYKINRDTDVTNIYGSDRELSGGSSGNGYNYPMLKAISVGLSVNF